MGKKTNKAAQGREPGEEPLSFEDALTQLQEIVARLEDGSLGLEESMQQFERGVGLLQSCYRILEQAEQRIEVLTGLDADGNPTTTPFDARTTLDSNKASPNTSKGSGGRRASAPGGAENRDAADPASARSGAAPAGSDPVDDGTTLF